LASTQRLVGKFLGIVWTPFKGLWGGIIPRKFQRGKQLFENPGNFRGPLVHLNFQVSWILITGQELRNRFQGIGLFSRGFLDGKFLEGPLGQSRGGFWETLNFPSGSLKNWARSDFNLGFHPRSFLFSTINLWPRVDFPWFQHEVGNKKFPHGSLRCALPL